MIKKFITIHKSMIYLYLCMVAVIPFVLKLCGQSLIPVWYSFFVITFLLLLYCIIDFLKFYSKIKFLNMKMKHLTSDKQLLTPPSNALEEEYQNLIYSLYDTVQEYIEMIEKSSTEQVEYYTMWVHQIKTPISALRLALQASNEDSHRVLMEQELFRIEQYVELALQYTRLKDIAADLVIGEYSLEEIIKQSVKKYASFFIYNKISVKIDDIDYKVITDSKWFSFVLDQLISNAVKYTKEGGICFEYEDKTLKISDTGIGIRKEDIDRIFEKGFTGFNGRLDKKASGLGLYLTKKVTDALAINMNIVSEVGKGTTILLRFPDLNEMQD